MHKKARNIVSKDIDIYLILNKLQETEKLK